MVGSVLQKNYCFSHIDFKAQLFYFCELHFLSACSHPTHLYLSFNFCISLLPKQLFDSFSNTPDLSGRPCARRQLSGFSVVFSSQLLVKLNVITSRFRLFSRRVSSLSTLYDLTITRKYSAQNYVIISKIYHFAFNKDLHCSALVSA